MNVTPWRPLEVLGGIHLSVAVTKVVKTGDVTMAVWPAWK